MKLRARKLRQLKPVEAWKVLMLVAASAISPLDADDCNGTGRDDLDEIADGSVPDCNRNRVPDSCDLRPVNLALEPRKEQPSAIYGVFADAMALADLDADGDLDLAAADSWNRQLTVFRNAGDGILAAPDSYSILYLPKALAAADLDADGDVDVAVAHNLDVTIFHNDGSGQFPTRTVLSPGYLSSLAAADLDGDGLKDLIVDAEAVHVLWNQGDHRFVLGVLYSPESTVVSVDAADLDGDGRIDVVIGGSAAVPLWNDGSRVFSAGQPLPCAGHAVTADLDGDGHTDVATPGCVLLNDGTGRFRTSDIGYPQASPDMVPVELLAADVDGDSDLDLVAAADVGAGDEVVYLWQNLGRGLFVPPVGFPQEGQILESATAGDLDGDGAAEVLVAHYVGQYITVLGESRIAYSSDCNGNLRPDECDISGGGSEDCDGNGRPDECEQRPSCCSDARDCNANGVADRCEVETGLTPDCNSNGVPDDCDLARGTSRDCNSNRVPDECEKDCNLNGSPDDCDIAGETSADANGNGQPDECEPWDMFGLSFRIPEATEQPESTAGRAVVFAQLETENRYSGQPGAQGWLVVVGSEGCRLVAATTSGTAAATVSEGGYWEGGFEVTLLEPDRNGGPPYAVSAVVLSFSGNITLPPSESPHDILKLTLERNRGERAPCAECRLYLPENADLEACLGTCQIVTWEGMSIQPSVAGVTFAMCVPRFRRGDANADGKVDISDAVRTFMVLFLGAANPRCEDAMDSNDDGSIDISDGINILNDFFRPDTGIPDPGPFECGVDPTPEDRLGCESYAHCG